MTKHLRFDYIGASYTGDNRHAQKAMRELGITWQHSTPQSMGDQFWFWNCENIPDDLPDYITEMKNDPMQCIGFGLDEETAIEIRDYENKN